MWPKQSRPGYQIFSHYPDDVVFGSDLFDRKKFCELEGQSLPVVSLKLTVTQACLNYMGSITLNSRYRNIGIRDGQLCLIKNTTRPELGLGNDTFTYVIYDDFQDPRGCCLNGAAAHRFRLGDQIVLVPLVYGDADSDADKFIDKVFRVPKSLDEPIENTEEIALGEKALVYDASLELGAIQSHEFNTTDSKKKTTPMSILEGEVKIFDKLVDVQQTSFIDSESKYFYLACYGKLHAVRVTKARPYASFPHLVVSRDMMTAAGLFAGSMASLVNNNSGARWTLPLFVTEEGSGVIEVRGLKGRIEDPVMNQREGETVEQGDKIIIMCYGMRPWSSSKNSDFENAENSIKNSPESTPSPRRCTVLEDGAGSYPLDLKPTVIIPQEVAKGVAIPPCLLKKDEDEVVERGNHMSSDSIRKELEAHNAAWEQLETAEPVMNSSTAADLKPLPFESYKPRPEQDFLEVFAYSARVQEEKNVKVEDADISSKNMRPYVLLPETAEMTTGNTAGQGYLTSMQSGFTVAIGLQFSQKVSAPTLVFPVVNGQNARSKFFAEEVREKLSPKNGQHQIICTVTKMESVGALIKAEQKNFVTPELKRVCVIGAGASGLSTLESLQMHDAKQEAEKAWKPSTIARSLDIVCYEMQESAGGLWNYNWRTGADDGIFPNNPVHGSMYKDLQSNSPKECIERFPFSWFEHERKATTSYPDQQSVLSYLLGYAEKLQVLRHIQFRTKVTSVSYDETRELFTVGTSKAAQEKRGTGNGKQMAKLVADEAEFDYLVVCNGHYSVPFVPSESQIRGIADFPGRVLHAHDFRNARAYKGENCLLIGTSYSAEDIALHIAKRGGKHVCVSHRRQPLNYKWPENITEVPGLRTLLPQQGEEFRKVLMHVVSQGENTVINKSRLDKYDPEKYAAVFSDGRMFLDLDTIMYCTGYLHSQPFLEEKLRIDPHNNAEQPYNTIWLQGLYKGLFNIDFPKCMWIGPHTGYFTINLFDTQADLIAAYIQNSYALPTKDAMLAEDQDYCKKCTELETFYGNHEYDIVCIRFQADYMKMLIAEEGKTRPLGPEDAAKKHQQIEDMIELWKAWEHTKAENIQTFRQINYKSSLTGTVKNVPAIMTNLKEDEESNKLNLSMYWQQCTLKLWNYASLANEMLEVFSARLGKPREELKVLHAACGAGDFCLELIDQGCANLHMTDGCPEMIQICTESLGRKISPRYLVNYDQLCQKPKVAYWRDLETVFGENVFDVVIIRGNCTPYVAGLWNEAHDENADTKNSMSKGAIGTREMVRSLKALLKVLKPGGLFFLDKTGQEEDGEAIVQVDDMITYGTPTKAAQNKLKREGTESTKLNDLTTSMSESYSTPLVASLVPREDMNDSGSEQTKKLSLPQVASLHWSFITKLDDQSRTWYIQSDLDDGSKFEMTLRGYWLTENLLKAMARMLGWEKCEKVKLENEKVYSTFLLQKKPANYDPYSFDNTLERYLKIWVGDSPQNSALNWGLWKGEGLETAPITPDNWKKAQEARFQDLLRKLKPLLDQKKKISVLDVGCGTGFTLNRLREEIGENSLFYGLGIDPSKEEMAYATEHFGVKDVLEFEAKLSSELMTEKYFETFDVVLSESAIGHAPYAAKVAFPDEAFKLLKPGGMFIFNDPVLGPEPSANGEVFIITRVGFDNPWPVAEWKERLSNAGFEQVTGEDEGFSQAKSYEYLAQQAAKEGYTDTARDYELSTEAIKKGAFTWGFFTAAKPL